MKILILATSLTRRSRCRVLADRAHENCAAAGADTALVDLHELSLPFCGAAGADADPQAVQLAERVRAADGIVIAAPVYNYDLNAACKNLIELTGEAWADKVVGFACVAGGPGSYMSAMSFANSLMLDFRCLVVPRFVYVTGAAVSEGQIVDPEIDRRLGQLCDAVMHLAGVWPPRE